MRRIIKSLAVIGTLIAITLISIPFVFATSDYYTWDDAAKTATIYKNSVKWLNITSLGITSGIGEFRETIAVSSNYLYSFNDVIDFGLETEKHKGKNDVSSKEYYLHVNTSYNISVLDYGMVEKNITVGNVTAINGNNITLVNGSNITTQYYNFYRYNIKNSTLPSNITLFWNTSEVIGSHNEIKYKDVLELYTPTNKKIEAGQTLVFDIVTKKQIEIGEFSILIQPVFMGQKIKELTWWNGSKLNAIYMPIPDGRRPYVFTFNMSNGTGMNNQTHIYGNSKFNQYFSGINFTLNNATEIPYWFDISGKTASETVFYVNVTANATSLDMYYNEGSLGTEMGNASNSNNVFPVFHGSDIANYNDSSKQFNSTENFVYEAKWQKASSTIVRFGAGNRADSFGGDGVMFSIIATLATGSRNNSDTNGGVTNTDRGAFGFGTNMNNYKIVKDNTGVYYYINNSYIGDVNANIPTKPIGLAVDTSIDTYSQEYSFIREYISPEPPLAPWGETESQPSFQPPAPVIGTVTIYNFGKNLTFSAGSGNVTVGFNVTRNGTWYNGTALFLNTTTVAHGWINDTIYAWNSTGTGTLSSGVTNNTQIPNNLITISGVLSSYTLNEGQSLTIDANYTDADSDVGVFSTNATKGSINSGTGIYTLNSVVGDQGIYNWNISVTDNNGSTSISNFTVTINYALVPATEPSGTYAFLNNSIPSNATILNYKNNSLLTTSVTLDWDNITSGNWTTLLSAINYSYTNGIRVALRLNLGGDYTDTSIQNSTKNNITTYFPDLTADPYQSDVQWIEFNFTNTTSPGADKRAYANLTAKNISEKSANKFPVYTVETLTGLDSDYVKSSPLIYLNVINNSDFVSQESVTTRSNTTKSRVYSGNESVLPLISYYKTGVFNKLRGTIHTSHPTESYATYVNNGSNGFDLILHNNLSTTQNRTVANQIGTFLDTNNDIMRKLVSSGTLHFNISAENFTYILNESVSKIILNDTAHQIYGASNTYNGTFTHGTNYTNQVHAFAGTNTDIKSELFDPSNIKTTLTIIHYEWINASGSGLVNYSGYKYVIVADKNADEINGTINRPDAIYIYYAVNDYVDNGDTWRQAKKDEIAWAVSRGYNVFLDGIDFSMAASNFSAGFKNVVDYIRINNSKEVICNTYTSYQDFATYCNAVMKESAFSRWDGSVSSPVYSWEDMTLEKQRADYYTSHNLPVITMAFGNVTDYQKQTFGYYATAVLYGLNGNNSYRYGQPNFQSQKEYTVPDFGAMLETGYTETSTTDWSRLYTKGRVHINPVAHTYWIDDAKVVNEMYLELYLYKASEGTGDLNLSLTINKPNGTMYNISTSEFNSASVGSWQYKKIGLSVSEYKDYGIYPVYASTRPNTGGWQIGLDITGNNKSGLHSWYDATTANVNTSGNDSDFTWGGWSRTQNYIMKLTVNYTTLLQIDTLNTTTINQSDSRASGNRTVTINSTNEYNATIHSKAVTLVTSSITSAWFKASNGSWIAANLPTNNVTDINATNIANWTYTVINGETFGMVQQYVDATHWHVRFLSPHLSTQEAMVGENVAPIISNVTNQTVNENNTVYVDIDGSDANGDPLTFSTNRSDIFTDFSSSTGKGNWTTNYSSSGTYYVDFGVSDGTANTNQTMIITITNIPLSITAFSPSGDVSVTKDTSQAFSITLNRTANVTWLLNSVSTLTNTSVTIANYTNSGATTGTFNITVNATDGVDTVSRRWNLTINAASTTTSSGGGGGSGIIPSGTPEPVEKGVKIYTTGVILSGDSARIPIMPDEKGELPSLRFLNLFFSTPYSGGYTFTTMTYTTYSPALEGAKEYFAVSSQPQIGATQDSGLIKDSNMELSSTTPITVYQLLSDNTSWYELKGTQKLSDSIYGVPITSLGVFAIKEAQAQVQVIPISKQISGVGVNFNIDISQAFKDIMKKDEKAYAMLNEKFAWLANSLPTLQEIRAGIQQVMQEIVARARIVLASAKL